MADEHVVAGVASQPSLPLFAQNHLHMSAEEVSGVRARLDEKGPMMALRFKCDRHCTNEKFGRLDRTLNDDTERIRLVELPGKGHSVLTRDFVCGGKPAQEALQNVLDYFANKLKQQ
jgi:hypothetical protein